MTQAGFPTDQLFSRQQVQQITGIPDDVLGFWMKEGLLVPVPSQARAHRRFALVQLNIAAVLNAMRSLGANIGVLRKFAGLIQLGVEICEASGFTREQLKYGDYLARNLNHFRSGEVVTVPSEAFESAYAAATSDYERAKIAREMEHSRPARDEAEIEEEWLRFNDREQGDLRPTLSLLRSLDEREAIALDLYCDLTMPDIVDHRNSNFNWVWVAWIDDEGEPQVASGEDGNLSWRARPAPASFYISISRLIRPLWVRDDPGMDEAA